jgi:glycosyltransferase involved in cell wall biosynthesis
MAVYNPNLTWLEQQLESINNQTYKNIELLVCDDCSSGVNFELIYEMVNKKIDKFPVSIYRNKNNLGCTKTFGDLAKKSKGDYIAFCDQDDIWEVDKINHLVQVLDNNENCALAYCKAAVIDENNILIEEDWNNMRKHANVGSGKKLYEALLFRTWIAGCFMLARADIIKKALPFAENIFYDQWVALIASLEGELICINESLIRYRRHGKTQTGSLVGIYSKQDYKGKYIDTNSKFMREAKERLSYDKIKNSLNRAIRLCDCREDWWQHFNLFSMIELFKGFEFDKQIIIFEILMARMPEIVFKRIIRYIKEGKI